MLNRHFEPLLTGPSIGSLVHGRHCIIFSDYAGPRPGSDQGMLFFGQLARWRIRVADKSDREKAKRDIYHAPAHRDYGLPGEPVKRSIR